jgi:arylsulfatase A-like enzyme
MRRLNFLVTGVVVSLLLSLHVHTQQGGALLQTTLQDPQAVAVPVNGTGVGAVVVTSPANDFVPGRAGNGIRIDGTGEYVKFVQRDSTVANVDFTRGAIDFWFLPFSANTDGARRTLVSLGQFGNATNGAHGIHLEKDPQSNLHVYVIDVNVRVRELVLAPTAYAWSAGQWMNIRLTWDFTVPVGVPSVHVFLDGVEPAATFSTLAGPLTMASASTTRHIFLGNRGTNTPSATPANGILDEVTIYDQPVPPAPPADTFAPALSNGQPSGTLPPGTTQAALGVISDENASCRYDTVPGTDYASMANAFSMTGGTTHTEPVTGLTDGSAYTFYVRCADAAGNANSTDFLITFAVSNDRTEPLLSNGQPSGVLPAGTTQAILSLTSDENAACRYDLTPGADFLSMSNAFTMSGGTVHSTGVSGLSGGNTYNFYVRCIDAVGNASAADFVISFSVDADVTPPVVSLSAPVEGSSVQGTIVINVTAADDVAVSYVEFYKDGVLFGRDNVASYQQFWETGREANGTHALQAVAYDTSMNSAASLRVTVMVNNSAPTPPPDIILIVTDDQRADTLPYMPLTYGHLAGHGVEFTNAFTSISLCCPSRATMLTGLYAHHHGVLDNDPSRQGGAPNFNDSSTLATWLQQAGYRTGLYGKYLNFYHQLTPWPYVPPGWSEWHALKADGFNYYNYTLVENGVEVPYGSQPADYSTDVLATKAVSFIEGTPAGTPLFLYFTPFAPHHPYTPGPNDSVSLPLWRPPSYNEPDVSDKPAWVQLGPAMSATIQAATDATRNNQVASLFSVDRAVDAIVAALQRTGRLSNAVVVFTSDNGFTWGEHRMPEDKACVYEECNRIPLLVRAPGLSPRTEASLISHVDLAATVAEFAGVTPPYRTDGASLVGLLHNPGPWREEFLMEKLQGIPGAAGSLGDLNRYYAVRTDRYVYAEYFNGDQEFYDLTIDPYQLDNRVTDPSYAAIISNLRGRLNELKNPPDVLPPVLSNGQPSGTLPAGTMQATLSLTSDENAACRYALAAGTDYSLMTNVLATTGATSHSTPVSGLMSGNVYTFYVRCADAAGNANLSDFAITFAVDVDQTPPGISNVQATGITTSSANISWSTDEPADSQVESGLDTTYGQLSALDTTLQTSHATPLSSLQAGITYHYRVLSRDAAGNLAVSGDFTLTTPVVSPNVLLQTTLEDAAAVSAPLGGTGAGSTIVTTPANDFVPAQSGNGIRIDGTGEYVRFGQSDGTTANIDFQRGAVDFWYQPFSAHSDGQRRTLISLGQFGSASTGAHGIHIEKDPQNTLHVYVIDSNVRLKELTVTSANYSWAAGQWVNLRLTWDFSVAAGAQSTRLYVNGAEPAYTLNTLLGPLSMAAPSSTRFLFLGNRGTNSNSSTPANGILDEVVLYSEPTPP